MRDTAARARSSSGESTMLHTRPYRIVSQVLLGEAAAAERAPQAVHVLRSEVRCGYWEGIVGLSSPCSRRRVLQRL